MSALADLIRHDAPKSYGAGAVYPFKFLLEKRYRFTSRYGDEVKLHRKVGDTIVLPRALCPVGSNDQRTRGMAIDFPQGPSPKPNQEKLFGETLAFLDAGLSGLVCAYTGWGKCLAPDEPVIMHDGTVRKTKHLVPGDMLMGPDSKPRLVRATNPGRGPMYRITPNRGEPFECNDVHMLSLRCTSDCYYGKKGEMVNVPLNEWQAWPASKKHVFKLWRSAVDFPEQKQRIDPYFLGVLIGDGSTKRAIGVTTEDPKIVAEVYRQAAYYGSSVPTDNTNTGAATTYFLRQNRGNANRCALRHELRCLGLQVACANKFIPRSYKVASREQRLHLLAGLIDTDGFLNGDAVFEIACKSPTLGSDIAFLARSLGFGVSTGEKTVNSVLYARLTIYGDTDLIPTRLPRKRAAPRRQIKNVLVTGFKVEPLGEGDWFGVELSGDHLYLLGDFTVTHNTVLGYAAAYALGRKTLVVTTKDDIYQQWIEGAQKFLGLAHNQVGEIRGDKQQVEGRSFVVAMIHTLAKGKLSPELAGQFGLVIFDECHRVPADTFSEVADMFPALWRLGMSATLERSDGKDLLLHAHIGPLRCATEAQLMIPKVLRFTSSWQCPRVMRTDEDGEKKIIRLPHLPGKTTHIEKVIAADPDRNKELAALIHTAYARGRRTVVFSTLHDHLHALHRAAHAMGISTKDMGYYIGATTKDEVAAREKASVKPVVFTTYGMAGEGTNLPWLDCCILAIPRAQVEQPVGRIRREYPDKPTPTVMDLVDYDSPVFAGYASSRMAWYGRCGAVVKQMN
jgi:hypothetical protein